MQRIILDKTTGEIVHINMLRPLEDVIDVLIAKNTFKKDELPLSVQKLHDLKKTLRAKI